MHLEMHPPQPSAAPPEGRQIQACGGFLQFPLPSLTPVGSSLPGREPPAESMARYLCRVVRIPTADPLIIQPPDTHWPLDLKSQISTLKSHFLYNRDSIYRLFGREWFYEKKRFRNCALLNYSYDGLMT